MRGSIFIKVFLGFWLITITVLASWSVANHYFDLMPNAGQRPGERPGPPPQFMLRLNYNLQNAAREELPGLVEAASQQQDVEIYLLNRQGEEILGRTIPATVARLAKQRQGPRRHKVIRHQGSHFAVQSIYRQDEGPLKAVIQWRPPRAFMAALGSSPLLRLGLAVLISGALCYLLSRLVTRRLRELRGVSRRLSEGELDTRIAVRERGGDETDELARDFNRMAEQLQLRIESGKQLLTDVSHELRSPLARLRIALALAQDQPERCAEHLQIIERETARLDELIGQLLSSQLENIVLDRHIDLQALLQDIARDADFEAGALNKRVEFSSRVDQALVASAEDLLRKCFDNIVRNAVKHTPQDTAVSIELLKTGDVYTVIVEDRGAGVPETDLTRIFEPFYRVDDARTRRDGGHGLGLSIARRAIMQHGGIIAASNNSPGLRVVVNLPAFPHD
jgi:two-component system sensor histidine kinase CpxA